MWKLNPQFYNFKCLMHSVTTKWHCFPYWVPCPRRFITLHMNHIYLPRISATDEESCVQGPDGIYSMHWWQMDLSQMELKAIQTWAQSILPCEDQVEPLTRHLKHFKNLQCKCSWSFALAKRSLYWQLDMYLIKLFSLGFLSVVQALRFARVWI